MTSMKVHDLIKLWQETANSPLTQELYSIKLPQEDAARLRALADLYPRRNITDIVTDLLSAALNDVETSLPYIRGSNVVAVDELGDPLYEDVGPTPKFLSLTQKHLEQLQGKTH